MSDDHAGEQALTGHQAGRPHTALRGRRRAVIRAGTPWTRLALHRVMAAHPNVAYRRAGFSGQAMYGHIACFLS